MLTIRPTQMLARRLGIGVPAAAPVVTNRVADWYAHEFRVARQRYLLFCNTASVYPVVMMAGGVTDGLSLAERLMGGLQTCLRGGELEAQFQRRILIERPVIQWAPIPGKSVLGSINELVFAAKLGLESQDYGPAGLSRWLAETPMKILGGNSPCRVFPKLGG
ncbi:hypothetical protein [Opitutus sp. GAS368]|jgi:hypothetical protein|uniref:DUF6933 domain-containing protein n=1 Tax=Opitutus sp. GAS368 TaxID=1882749 RepID=UPI00087CB3CE|nr:hypothetical protein [Opitutus sp. GAS368]SDR80329.1 hypothetical protein SAMN05444173_0936 [Opitutus sp. GAS368]